MNHTDTLGRIVVIFVSLRRVVGDCLDPVICQNSLGGASRQFGLRLLCVLTYYKMFAQLLYKGKVNDGGPMHLAR